MCLSALYNYLCNMKLVYYFMSVKSYMPDNCKYKNISFKSV